MNFHAMAYNEQGDRFMFFFSNVFTLTTEEAADAELAKIVAADDMHKERGPWHVEGIDVGGA